MNSGDMFEWRFLNPQRRDRRPKNNVVLDNKNGLCAFLGSQSLLCFSAYYDLRFANALS